MFLLDSYSWVILFGILFLQTLFLGIFLFGRLLLGLFFIEIPFSGFMVSWFVFSGFSRGHLPVGTVSFGILFFSGFPFSWTLFFRDSLPRDCLFRGSHLALLLGILLGISLSISPSRFLVLVFLLLDCHSRIPPLGCLFPIPLFGFLFSRFSLLWFFLGFSSDSSRTLVG